MNWILLAAFAGSSGLGPTVPQTLVLEFADRDACVAAVKTVDDLTRRHRVMHSKLDWVCIPKASESKG
jgi:hypothetical protein